MQWGGGLLLGRQGKGGRGRLLWSQQLKNAALAEDSLVIMVKVMLRPKLLLRARSRCSPTLVSVQLQLLRSCLPLSLLLALKLPSTPLPCARWLRCFSDAFNADFGSVLFMRLGQDVVSLSLRLHSIRGDLDRLRTEVQFERETVLLLLSCRCDSAVTRSIP